MPEEGPPNDKLSKEEARRLFQAGLDDDIERQKREPRKEGYALPEDQQGPQTPSEVDETLPDEPEPPVFPAASTGPTRRGSHDIGITPSHPDWTRYVLGAPPVVGPPPIQDPALAGRQEGGTAMSGALAIVKARLLAAAQGLQSLRVQSNRSVDTLNNQWTLFNARRSSLESEITYLRGVVERLEEEKGVIIRATDGHQVAAPTRVLHQIDLAIREGNEAIGTLRAAYNDISNAMARSKQASISAEHMVTQVSAAMAELDSYRTSF